LLSGDPSSFLQEATMQELLPFSGGLAIGIAFSLVTMHRWRWLAFPVACAVGGVLQSWLNGELTSTVWPLFVSFDAFLVWAGASLVLAIGSVRYRFA
jgi:xanthosine utilization system XapX-like protein